jgi:hypothetical protein
VYEVKKNSIWVRALLGPMHLGLKTGPLCPMFYSKLKDPSSFQMAPMLSFLISSGSRKKEPRHVRLSEAKVSLRLKILKTSGSKKGTQISFLFSQNSRQTNPSRSPNRAPIRGRSAYRASCIYLSLSQKKNYIPGSPVKELPQGPPPRSLFR